MTEDNIVPINEDIDIDVEDEEPQPEQYTVIEATEALSGELMRISKKTKMSETGVMNIYSFFIQQEERNRMKAEQQALQNQQRAQMEQDKQNLRDIANETITGEADE